MNEQIRATRSPVSSAVSLFMGSTAILALIAAGLSYGLLARDVGRRGIYIVLGLLMVLLGNALPKLRPIARWRADARRIEVLAGAALMLAGVTWILDFALTPSAWTNWLAAGASTVASLIIAGCLLRVLHRPERQRAGAVILGVKQDRRARLTFWLLAALLYLLVVATTKLMGESSRLDVSSWVSWVFGFIYAMLFVVLEKRKS